MRRAVLALTVAGVFLTGACGTAADPASTPTPGGNNAAAGANGGPADSPTKQLCVGLGEVYSNNMAPLARTLGKLAATRQSKGDAAAAEKDVQQSLISFGSAVLGATQGSADTQVRADGKTVANQLQAKAKDKKFLSSIKTPEDVNKAVGPTLKEWLAPVQHHCA